MKLSVIIPIYNQEKFLEECLNSILLSINYLYEVILIDDGSIDSSSKICKDYVHKNNKFKYFYYANQGVSSARNNGLNVAKGDFVMFVDPDDIVNFSFLSEQYFFEDITFLNTTSIDDNNRQIIDISNFNNHEAIKFLVNYKSEVLNLGNHCKSCWGKIYKMTIINNNKINFDTNLVSGEDFIFNIKYLLHTNSALFIDKVAYLYRINELSVTNNYIKNMTLNYQHIVDNLKSLLDNIYSNDKYLYEYILRTFYELIVNQYRYGYKDITKLYPYLYNNIKKSTAIYYLFSYSNISKIICITYIFLPKSFFLKFMRLIYLIIKE